MFLKESLTGFFRFLRDSFNDISCRVSGLGLRALKKHNARVFPSSSKAKESSTYWLFFQGLPRRVHTTCLTSL